MKKVSSSDSGSTKVIERIIRRYNPKREAPGPAEKGTDRGIERSPTEASARSRQYPAAKSMADSRLAERSTKVTKVAGDRTESTHRHRETHPQRLV